MTTTSTTPPSKASRVGRIAAIAVAGATLGITGSFAVTNAQDAPAPATTSCRASAADLQRAAEAARMLQAQRPELFEVSPRPADYHDLRLAAEWARRLDHLDPDGPPAPCGR